MKERTTLFTILFIIAAATGLQAQNTSSIGSSVGVFIFPAEGQDQAQQDADEFACFNWAKQQTGYDPMNPTQVQAAEVDRSADGSAVRGAARGAAAGAAIGAIAGDTGKGAAIGAAAGGMRGRRAKVYGDEAQQQQNYANAEAAEAQMLEEYKRAFAVCMEAKGYTVK
ncbi:MAG: glycine zipper family protein [Flavobacteriaceae bacterium]